MASGLDFRSELCHISNTPLFSPDEYDTECMKKIKTVKGMAQKRRKIKEPVGKV